MARARYSPRTGRNLKALVEWCQFVLSESFDLNSLSTSASADKQVPIVGVVVHDEIARGRIRIPAQSHPIKRTAGKLRQHLA